MPGQPLPCLHVGIIGDYDAASPSHLATAGALSHAAETLGVSVDATWLPTASLEANAAQTLRRFDALWCAPGSPYRSLPGALQGIRFARENGVPFIGTCGGFQHVVIEYARHVLGFVDAQHAEYDPYASTLFISALTCSLVGKTMQVRLKPDSRAYACYRQQQVEEPYYCNFGLNPAHQATIDEGGLRIVGTDQDGEPRILELPQHDFFVATLFVPQMTSSPGNPHPLILAYLKAAHACKLLYGSLGVWEDGRFDIRYSKPLSHSHTPIPPNNTET